MNVKNLSRVLVSSTAETDIWSDILAPSSSGALISNITFANTTASAISVSLFYYVSDTNTLSTSGPHLLRRSLSVAANQNQIIDYGISLGPSDKLSVIASAPGLAVNVFGAADIGYSYSSGLIARSSIGSSDEVELVKDEYQYHLQDNIVRSVIIANTSGSVADQISLAIGVPRQSGASIFSRLYVTDQGQLYGSNSNNLANFEDTLTSFVPGDYFGFSQIKYIVDTWFMSHGNGFYTSPNGTEWYPGSTPGNFSGFANIGKNMVASQGRNYGNIWKSSDLVNFEEIFLQPIFGDFYTGFASSHVASANSRFAVAARADYGTNFTGTSLYSAFSTNNGSTWSKSGALKTPFTNNSSEEFQWEGLITNTSGLFVAIMTRDYPIDDTRNNFRTNLDVSTSTDGNAWTSRYTSGDINVPFSNPDFTPTQRFYVEDNKVASSGTKMLIWANRTMLYSSNGTSWTSVSRTFIDPLYDTVISVFVDETDKFYLSMQTGALWSSTNGTTWTQTYNPGDIPGSSSYYSNAFAYGYSAELAAAGGPVYDQSEYVLKNTALAANSTIVLGPEHGYAIGSGDTVRFKSNTGNSIATIFGAPAV